MKEPTTPFAIGTMEKMQITRKFLLEQGWELDEDKPLFETFKKGQSYYCMIGMYGDFSIGELHWLNRDPERYFHTRNSDLTIDDYFTIIKLLNIAP